MNQKMVDNLANIQSEVYDLFNTDHALFGIKYDQMVLAMAQKILTDINIDDITPEVIDGLTACNSHMVVHAIEAVQMIDKYSCREYLERK